MFLLIAIWLLVKVAGWIFYAQTAMIDPDPAGGSLPEIIFSRLRFINGKYLVV
jgi:hypothetical protein